MTSSAIKMIKQRMIGCLNYQIQCWLITQNDFTKWWDILVTKCCMTCCANAVTIQSYSLLCITPWEEVTTDLIGIGSWKVKVNGRQFEFNGLKCIETGSNLVELVWIKNKTAEHIHYKLMQSWLYLPLYNAYIMREETSQAIFFNSYWKWSVSRMFVQKAKICSQM